MTETLPPVGLKQRMPLDVLTDALCEYLSNGIIEEAPLLGNLKSIFSGPYNIQLAFNGIKSCILNPSIQDFLKANKEGLIMALRHPEDAKIIDLSMINIRYPFSYYVTSILATNLELQPQLSREVLINLLGKKYTMNATAIKGLRVGLTHLVEGGLLQRVKSGVYGLNDNLKPRYKVTLDFWRMSHILNNPLLVDLTDESLAFSPYVNLISKK